MKTLQDRIASIRQLSEAKLKRDDEARKRQEEVQARLNQTLVDLVTPLESLSRIRLVDNRQLVVQLPEPVIPLSRRVNFAAELSPGYSTSLLSVDLTIENGLVVFRATRYDAAGRCTTRIMTADECTDAIIGVIEENQDK